MDSFITVTKRLNIPIELTEKLDLNNDDLIEVKVTKLYINEKLRKEIIKQMSQ